MMNEQESSTAARRAAAAIVHYGTGDDDGVQAVFDEIGTVIELQRFALALLWAHESALPPRQRAGWLEHVRAAIPTLAAGEHDTTSQP